MHHLDLGLFQYQLKYTIELLESKNQSLVNEMNQRIAAIPRHPNLKIFAGGLQSISRLTANEYRDIMKVMVFVIDDLLSDETSDDSMNKKLSEVYVKWNEMYLISRLEEFKESDLVKFQVINNIFKCLIYQNNLTYLE
jgi:hypothetical protein